MASKASPDRIDTRQYRTSFRLIFRFDGKQVSLARAERLQKIAPGTTSDRPRAGENSGAWLELVDSRGRVLFHVLLYDPLHMRAEHHSPDGKIELHLRDAEPCEFWAIVPEIPGGSKVILYLSPSKREHMFEAASEVGRFRLPDKDERGDER